MNVNCPGCKKRVKWSATSEFRPFCSKQCQLIDLGEWAAQDNVITAPLSPQDMIDPEDIEALLASQSDAFFKQ